ncbi:MAG: RNA polymerase sigma factor [Planctomycetes bacterium]|nr:RNA polymerase sigma factor [Planctomycetota bacterium]MCB9888962.1 RNA polymerase sigma factor [Planctomycetota bacterium]
MQDTTSAETMVLLARHRSGDENALPSLILRYYPRVTRLVRARLGPERLARAEIEDYVQDVFVRILSSVDKFEKRSNAEFIDWVATAATNDIRNHARHDRAKKRGGDLAREVQRHAEESLAIEVAAETTEVPLKASRGEEQDRLDACVSRLLPQHREVIDYSVYTGYDWRTVAAKMGRTVEACQELLRRAKSELREKFLEQS